jgi:hypothetical protein
MKFSYSEIDALVSLIRKPIEIKYKLELVKILNRSTTNISSDEKKFIAFNSDFEKPQYLKDLKPYYLKFENWELPNLSELIQMSVDKNIKFKYRDYWVVQNGYYKIIDITTGKSSSRISDPNYLNFDGGDFRFYKTIEDLDAGVRLIRRL